MCGTPECMAMYSASGVDSATIGCFREKQATRHSFKQIAAPEWDLRPALSFAYSECEKSDRQGGVRVPRLFVEQPMVVVSA